MKPAKFAPFEAEPRAGSRHFAADEVLSGRIKFFDVGSRWDRTVAAGSRSDGAIRIGPGRRRPFLLDADHQEPEAELSPVIDWHAIARAAGLTRLEKRILLKHWRDCVPAYQLPQLVGCSPAEAARARNSVAEKLSARRADPLTGGLSLEPARDSLRVAYRDRLPSGRRPWAIAGLCEYFVEIMNEEKCFGLFSQQDPDKFQKSRRFCPAISRDAISQNTEVVTMSKEIDIFGRMVASRTKLEGKLHEARATLQKLNDDGREPDAGNIERQQAIIAELEVEIASLRHTAFLTEIEEPRRRLAAALDVLVSTSREVMDIFVKYGPAVSGGHLLFPPADPCDPAAHGTERAIALGLVNSAAQLAAIRGAYTQEHRWRAA